MVAKCEWCSLGTLKINETSPKLFNIWVIIYESSKNRGIPPGLNKIFCLDWKWIKIDKIFEKNFKPFFDPLSISSQTYIFGPVFMPDEEFFPNGSKISFRAVTFFMHLRLKWIKITEMSQILIIFKEFLLFSLKIWSTSL